MIGRAISGNRGGSAMKPLSPTPCGNGFSRCCRPHPAALSLPRPQAARRPQDPHRHPLRPQDRHRLGRPARPNSAAGAARPVGTTSNSGTTPASGSSCTPCCWPNSTAPTRSIGRAALIDASFAKAPEGGEDTGPNPTDRGKSGSKHHVSDRRQRHPAERDGDRGQRQRGDAGASTF